MLTNGCSSFISEMKTYLEVEDEYPDEDEMYEVENGENKDENDEDQDDNEEEEENAADEDEDDNAVEGVDVDEKRNALSSPVEKSDPILSLVDSLDVSNEVGAVGDAAKSTARRKPRRMSWN